MLSRSSVVSAKRFSFLVALSYRPGHKSFLSYACRVSPTVIADAHFEPVILSVPRRRTKPWTSDRRARLRTSGIDKISSLFSADTHLVPGNCDLVSQQRPLRAGSANSFRNMRGRSTPEYKARAGRRSSTSGARR